MSGFALLKPITMMAALICETAKVVHVIFSFTLIFDTGKQTVNGNRADAFALARHAQDVTNSVVERAKKSLNDPDSVVPLRLTLEEIQAFLKLLRSRKRLKSWIFAAKDKDRFTELNDALDRALAVFVGSQSIEIASTARENTRELATLQATVHRVEDDVQRTMMLIYQCSTAKHSGWR
ncbi:hypothetical protein C8R45DRAFT_1106303 [Mycena sanguinolenta]|nr:hypothetical protein C8R45DRAFT_1106303 [Mycena sanguinolenta]